MVKSSCKYCKAGTILFQRLKDETSFNRSVSLSGAIPHSKAIIANINHVGLCIDNDYVIEATRKDGVIQRRLNDFLAQANYNVTARIKDDQLLENAIKRAKSCLGLPYNHSFHPDAAGFYCSELITYAFKNRLGEDYFQQYPMNFVDLASQQILPYWIAYYRLLNQAVPNGLPGSHPQQLLRQTHLFRTIRLLE